MRVVLDAYHRKSPDQAWWGTESRKVVLDVAGYDATGPLVRITIYSAERDSQGNITLSEDTEIVVRLSDLARAVKALS